MREAFNEIEPQGLLRKLSVRLPALLTAHGDEGRGEIAAVHQGQLHVEETNRKPRAIVVTDTRKAIINQLSSSITPPPF
jgi:hypothetical protein